MADDFDPYLVWLGIPPEEQPPDHYRLLGIQLFQSNPKVIEAAADQRVGQLHAVQRGDHAKLALKLLNEVAAAKVCLLNHHRKTAYDMGLRQRLQDAEAAARTVADVQRGRVERFLDLLEVKDLLPVEVLVEQRRQIDQASRILSVEVVAQRLINAGYLTPALAKRLQVAALEPPAEPDTAPPRIGRRRDFDATPHNTTSVNDDLGFAPVDDELPPWHTSTVSSPSPTASKPAAGEPATQGHSDTGSPQRASPWLGTLPPEGGTTNRGGTANGGGTASPRPSPWSGSVGGHDGAGPLDELLADAQLDAAAAGGPLIVRPRKKGLRAFLSRPWVIWSGGAAAAALIVVIGVLVWMVTRPSGDEALQLANEDYTAGSYAQAIRAYDQFLRRFPDHAGVSVARVNRGLAQLKLATARGTSDWPAALDVAKEVLEQIDSEAALADDQGDLAAMLLRIAEGLTAQAREKPDRPLVAQAQEGLALLEKHLPGAMRQDRRVVKVRASLAQLMHETSGHEELAQAISLIKKAAAQGDLSAAYEVRSNLLKQYPHLADAAELVRAMQEVSRTQQTAVRFVQRQQPSEKTELATPLLATVALAHRDTRAEAPGAAGHVICAIAEGVAYGLDAATGKVIWRRFLGSGGSGLGAGFPPLAVSGEPGGDLILVQPVRSEVLRVEAATGRLRWRHAIGERFDIPPVLAGESILVATPSGRLVKIDAASGASAGYTQLPQPPAVAPAVDSARGLVFVAAGHSNLYVLGLADGRCLDVLYLGHEQGTIAAPPAVAGQYLIVVVNDRAEDSVLRVASLGEASGGRRLKLVQQVRLEGHVSSPLAVDGRNVLVAGDLGNITVFEINGSDGKPPLRKTAATLVTRTEAVVRFPLLKGGRFWIADTQLGKWEILPAGGEVVPQWTSDDGSTFLQPLAAIGQTIFHVRRKSGTPGFLVAAVAMDEPKLLWQTRLAVPLATEPSVDAQGKVLATTAMGALFQIEQAPKTVPAALDQPLAALETTRYRQPFVEVVSLGGGRLALVAGEGSSQIALYEPERDPRQVRLLLSPEVFACPPVAFGGGLLAPTKAGPLLLLDPTTGAGLAEPFLPQSAGGPPVAWRSPALVGTDTALLADGQKTVYRVAVEGQPKARLAALGQIEIASPIVSPLAALENVAYAVDAAGTVAAFDLPALGRREVGPALTDRCVWGPRRVGNHALLATADDELLCLDAKGQLAWRTRLPYGPLAGTPLVSGDHFLLAAKSGGVCRIEAATGKELGRIELNQPLATGPVLWGEHLLLGSPDGCLYRVPKP